ncbi:transglutaminase-like domain-containing protein [Thalassoglobus sp. JC818]|uniref:transglutaminase-like domain-containing protein n=1 Tax=Thalassoglobus sp. JC818 TaxID=3232136 RepID=UPI003459B289
MSSDPAQSAGSSPVSLQGKTLKSAHSQPEGIDDLSSTSSQLMTLLLAAIAVLVHAIVVADEHYGALFWGCLLLQTFGMLIASWWFRRRIERLGHDLFVSPLLVLAGLSALAWEGISRQFLDSGQPFEIITMSAIRNLVIGLAIASVKPAPQKLTVALSLFLVIFGVTTCHDRITHWLAGTFALGGVVWLSVSHWENVSRRLKGREKVRWPRWVVAVPILLIVVGIGAISANQRAAMALHGFLPSSGGTGDDSPYSRNGVGSGERLVAGTDSIQSFAPIEDAPFMQDDKPSLYDVFDDLYQEEVKMNTSDRAIALPPELGARAKEHLHSQIKKANREFSTLREPTKDSEKRKVKDVDSDAMFYVAGRVPLHLRSQIYDLFDGISWYPQKQRLHHKPFEISESAGKPWLRLHDAGEFHEFLGPAETHALKIINLDTNVIPSPLYTHGIHIDLVDRPDMFQHGPPGLVALDRKSLPSLVPIHVASRSIDWDALNTEEKLFLRAHTDQAISVIPTNIDREALDDLAEQICDGIDEGWPQIAAVRDYLRTHYKLNPDWRPQDTETPGVEQFLFESHEGPDYQFATAAALLLRSLGYASRVVSGFYADPNRYDADSQHTPVLAEDVHFWTEVRVYAEDWITVEATPGYEVLGPPLGLFQEAWNVIVAGIDLIIRHWILAIAAGLTLVALWWARCWLVDRFETGLWRLKLWRTPDLAVANTLKLLRQRARLIGHQPKISITHHQWLSELMACNSHVEESQMLYQLRREIDIAAYARHLNNLTPETIELCHVIGRNCSLSWFRGLYNEQPSNDSLEKNIVESHPPESRANHGELLRK